MVMSIQPIRARAPTQRQIATLVLSYCEGGDLSVAAGEASMSLAEASHALRMPGARQMVARAMRHQLDVVAAPMALAVAMSYLRNQSAPARIRADMAKSILDRAGLIAQPMDAARERNLSELSADDLRALIDELTSEAAERATMPGTVDRGDDFLD